MTRHVRSWALAAVAAFAWAALPCLPLGSIAHAGIIEWVTVGDPGNTADTAPAGYGAVAASFQIMKYEFTNQLYTEFLNSVDRNGTNPYSVYNANMGSNARGGISFTSGNASGSKYATKSNMGDKPVNYVSWFDAARVSNWLMNGALSSSSTETGAYTLVGGQTSGTAPAVNPGARFYVPTEDQWYKAAYYKGGGTSAGYWNYATQSDSAPTAVTAGSTGIGSAGSTGNSANYSGSADWNSQDGNVTTVGTNGGPSTYGAFDMSGNLLEWNDLTGAAGSSRGLRGGNWNDNAFYVSSSSSSPYDVSNDSIVVGFRLARPVSSSVPEIDPAMGSSALSLVAGVLAMIEQRRRRATLVA
jgi:formylglycine-generating enzyme required for sulfatase activity